MVASSDSGGDPLVGRFGGTGSFWITADDEMRSDDEMSSLPFLFLKFRSEDAAACRVGEREK